MSDIIESPVRENDNQEIREMRAHDNLIMQVIKRQAGTLGKAIMEGVMNVIDYSRARRADITVTESRVTIRDEGRGFQSAEEIKTVFEVFGHPHDLDEDGISRDAKFGTFRIGRGQLFAFGKNRWRSNEFEMVTDVDRWGLKYILETDLDKVPGCCITIDLYRTLSPGDIRILQDEVTRLCRYVGIRVLFNREDIALNPAQLSWDHEFPGAYVNVHSRKERWSSNGLDIYQQGAFVETIPSYRYGLVGTVVIKEPVAVNFARNQVLQHCPRWKEIVKDILNASKAHILKKKGPLNPDEARAVLECYADGRGGYEFSHLYKVKCWPDVLGKMWSIYDIELLTRTQAKVPKVIKAPDGAIPVAFAAAENPQATMVLHDRRGLVLDNVILSHLGVDEDSEAFAYLLGDKANTTIARLLRLVDLTDLLQENDDEYVVVAAEDLRPKERMIVGVLQNISYYISAAVKSKLGVRTRALPRTVNLGIHPSCDGWTDGFSYVVINREKIGAMNTAWERDWTLMVLLLAKFYCFRRETRIGDAVGPDYYQDFHDLTGGEGPSWGRRAWQIYTRKALHRVNKKEGWPSDHISGALKKAIGEQSQALVLGLLQEELDDEQD